MNDPTERSSSDGPVTLIRSLRSVLVEDRGALLSIRRAVLTAEDLRLFREAIDGLDRDANMVFIAVYRLDPRFKVQPSFDSDLGMLVDTLRAIDRRFDAIASVLEFGGMRAATMRVASRAVWALARPHSKLASFDRLVDAARWITPHARKVGAPDDLASYVRTYRLVEQELGRLDAEGLSV